MTNRIENITDRIRADGEAERERILADARKEADALAASYAGRAEAIRAMAAEQADKESRAAADRAESAAESALRSSLLAAKGELVNAAFLRAEEKLEALEEKRYTALLSSLLDAAIADYLSFEDACRSYEEEFLPVNDLSLVMAGQDAPLGETLAAMAAEKLKSAGKSLRVASPDPALGRGFLLVAGDITTDCTLSSLIAAEKGRLEGEVYRILFS